MDQVYNLIRACNPAPGAWTDAGGVRTWIYDCRKIAVRQVLRRARQAGRDRAPSPTTSIVINSQGGQIEVLKLRPEGGKKMGAGDFARERGLAISAS